GYGEVRPAISVLAAVGGVEVVAPGLHAWLVQIAVVVLLALFSAQRFGPEKVGLIFGPIMVLWFLALAALGLANILHEPEVLKAINPCWAVQFFIEHTRGGIFILGAVVLAVTGGEALDTGRGRVGPRRGPRRCR